MINLIYKEELFYYNNVIDKETYSNIIVVKGEYNLK